MSFSDFRIIIVFSAFLGFVALFSAVFGMEGTYLILGVSVILNGLCLVLGLIANGNL